MKFSSFLEAKKMKGDDPCWKGYRMVGKKTKNGKEVPNCVPVDEAVKTADRKPQMFTDPEGKKRVRMVPVDKEIVKEKAVSQAQQKMMGMALAYKRGEMPDASQEIKDLAKSMSTKDLEDFAKTKHKGLPVKKESVEQIDEAKETTKLIKDLVKIVQDYHNLFSYEDDPNDEYYNAYKDALNQIEKIAGKKVRDQVDKEKPVKRMMNKSSTLDKAKSLRKYGTKKDGTANKNAIKKFKQDILNRISKHTMAMKGTLPEEVELDEWEKETPWRKSPKVRKDKYGNVIKPKNIAKHLAKAAQKQTAKEEAEVSELTLDKLRAYRKKAVDDVASNKKADKRAKGVAKASNKIYRKEFDALYNKESTELDEMDLSKHDTKKLLQFHRKYADRKMGPSDANQVRAVRRELIKRGALKNEEVQMDEAKTGSGDALMDYAKKSGGIDKASLMKLAGKLQNHSETGNPSTMADIVKMVKSMDTEPRDQAMTIIQKNDPAMYRSIVRKAKLAESNESRTFFDLRSQLNEKV